MYFKTEAIVISSLKYADNSLIVRCFTKEFGTKSYLLQGILSPKKNGLKVALFQPFMQLELIATHKNTGVLERIKEAKVSHQYQSLYTNVYKSSVAMFLAEVCSYVCTTDHSDVHLFEFLAEKLLFFDKNDFSANFHLKFMVDLTLFLGFYPDDSHSDGNFFSLEEGVFSNSDESKYTISGDELVLFKEIINAEYADLQQIRVNKTLRNSLLYHLLKFYEWHLPNFGEIKSLSVLRTIFG